MDTLTVEFEQYPDAEFVLRLSPVPMTTYWDIGEYKADWSREAFTGLIALMEPLVVSTPVPLAEVDPNILIALRNHWLTEVATLPLPLPRTSSDTAPPKAKSRNPRPSNAPS